MNKFIGLLVIFIIAITNINTAQISFNLNESFTLAIPDSAIFLTANNDTILFGGISGIEPAPLPNQYYLIPDKSDDLSGYFIAEITFLDEIVVKIIKFQELNAPGLEGEAIRINPNNKQIYLADERKNSTGIYQINRSNTPIKLSVEPSNYFRLMQWNAGFEGLCFTPNGSALFASVEKPLSNTGTLHTDITIPYVCPILFFPLSKGKQRATTYGYPLQRKTDDNGISELLTLNDSILFVVERAYLKNEDRNIVRIFSVNLNNTIHIKNTPIDIHGITELLNPKLLFNFEHPLLIGNQLTAPCNIEAISFSSDKKYLLLVSDNNYGNSDHTPTQIIALKIK